MNNTNIKILITTAKKFENANDFANIINEKEPLILSTNQKVFLITGFFAENIDIEDIAIKALVKQGIGVYEDFVGIIDVIRLDNDLTAYLKENKDLLKNFYNSMKKLNAI